MRAKVIIAYIMFSIIVIIFEFLAVLFISIFARTNSTTVLSSSDYSLVTSCASLLLAFTLLYSPFRRLSLFTYVSLLLVISVAAQTNILFGTLWDSCFNGFSSSFDITSTLLVRSLFAALAALLTSLDFVGLFAYWQIYLIIAPIMTVGFALTSSIIVYGLKCFDGGGGVTVFLYSGVCSLIIWAMCIRGKIDKQMYRVKESYSNQTLAFIGVVLAFITWPKFNMAGASLSFLSITGTASTLTLQNSSLANSFLGLSASILLSIVFASNDSKQQRLKQRVYVDVFINGGIVIASFQDIALNPAAALVMVATSSFVTLLIHKHFLTPSETEAESAFKIMMRNYGKIIYRILFSLLGCIVSAIVVASRSSQTPSLLVNTYSKIAGFQIVAWLVGAIFGALFGAITAAAINGFLGSKKAEKEADKQAEEKEQNIQEVTDEGFFQGFINEEMHPLYYDIFDQIKSKEKERINLADYTTKVIKQSLLGAQDSPLRIMTVTKNAETKADPRDARMVIQKDFSKSNFKNEDVSKMKVFQNKLQDMSEDDNRQQEIIVNPTKDLKIHKSKLKITQNEAVPENKHPQVRRRLGYSQDSEIKEESMGNTLIRK